MQISITSQSEIADPVELEAILREYLGQEVRNMRSASGIDVALDGLVSATTENIDAYLPPVGRL